MPMDADPMPIWTRNIVWIPDQGHSSAVRDTKSGYTCIEKESTIDRCFETM